MDVLTYSAAKDAKLKPLDLRRMVEGNLGLVPLCARGIASVMSDGTKLSETGQLRYTQRIGGRSLRFQFTNHANSGASSIEASTPNPITVKAGMVLSVTGGIPVPILFNGQPTATLQPDQTIFSDPVEVDVPQGTNFWLDTFVSVTSLGMRWPKTTFVNAGRNEGVVTEVDHTGTTSGIPTYSNSYAYGAVAVWGVPYSGSRPVRLALVGDSILRGFSQTDADDGLNIIPPLSQTSCIPIAAFGELANGFAKIDGHRRRIASIDGANAWMCNYGTNDLSTGTPTFAAVAANLLTIWKVIYERLGVPGVQWTLGPRTTSIDAWATVANQAIQYPISNGVRIAINAWIRDGAPILNGAVAATGSAAPNTLRIGTAGHPLSAYFDVADIVESARDSGVFKAAFSFDGVHYTPAAYAAIATGVNWAKLGIV